MYKLRKPCFVNLLLLAVLTYWSNPARAGNLFRRCPKPCCPPATTADSTSETTPFDVTALESISSLETASSTQTLAPNMIGDAAGGACGTIEFGGMIIGETNHPVFSCSRIKIAENNSPVPRDRVYFTYQHFSNLSRASVTDPDSGAGAASAVDLDRFTFGLEKTLFGDRLSTEIRVPISYELTNNITMDYDTIAVSDDRSTELGNISLVLKYLYLQRRTLGLSGGFVLHLPTEEDVRIRPIVTRGMSSIRHTYLFRNQAVILSPWMGGLWTPNDRVFVQAFTQLDVDLSGHQFKFDPVVNTVPQATVTNRLNEQTLLRADVGAGFWVIRNPNNRWLTGVAPTIELHYTTTLDDADVLPLPEPTFGGSVAVGNIANRLDIVDLTLGTTVEVANRSTLALGCVIPLNGAEERGFDFEFNLQFNYRFGRSVVR